CLLFFFSSRRRHTRFSRDWSSDVCSSDLQAGIDAAQDVGLRIQLINTADAVVFMHDQRLAASNFTGRPGTVPVAMDVPLANLTRSEERRVGKECRDGGSLEH